MDCPQRTRASYLTVAQQFDLNHACRMLRMSGYSVYLVGSVLYKSDYRDVDVRAILEDAEYDFMFVNTNPNEHRNRLLLLNVALSGWLSARTGLSVDFQFQRCTEANAEYPTQERHALGIS